LTLPQVSRRTRVLITQEVTSLSSPDSALHHLRVKFLRGILGGDEEEKKEEEGG